MKKILLTGVSGFFGSRFYDYYKDKYEIIPFTSRELDVTDEKKVTDVVKQYNPDYVINTAAITATKACEENPEKAYNINVLGSVHMAKACSMVNAKMVYFSSEQVFNGHLKQGPFLEEDVSKPVTEYGRDKLKGEKLVKEILNEKLWILRFSWMFGLPERNKKGGANIVWNVAKAALKGEKIRLAVNERRGMTYVYDVVENFKNIFEIPYGTYNLGSTNSLTTYETGKLVENILGCKNVVFEDFEKYKDHLRDLRMNTDKLEAQGISFETTEKAIERCIKEYMK